MTHNETIAAISTPPGTGAIGVVRISGDKSLFATKKLFSPQKAVAEFESRKAYLGCIKDNDQILDQVVVTIYKKPASYTGEDVVEISCHGGVVVLNKVLEAFLKQGIRPAPPGEFTKRAFLNGKMDLMQAEAVEDIIRAESELALFAAQNLLSGKLTEKVQAFKEGLIDLICGIEAEIEFPEENDVTENLEYLQNQRKNLLNNLINEIEQLSDSFSQGFLLKEGYTLALFGAPNTGKSTLLNRLIGYERALVSSKPGTTRDYIREKMFVQGIPLTCTDMAGIRTFTDNDEIEKAGIQQCKHILKEATIAAWVIDGGRELDENDHLAFESCPNEIPKLYVLNKADLPLKTDLNNSLLKNQNLIRVSALNGEGLGDLLSAIQEYIGNKTLPDKSEIFLTHIRHKDSLVQCKNHLLEAMEHLDGHTDIDLLAYNLREGIRSLQILTGEVTADDILNQIFQNFCIGK